MEQAKELKEQGNQLYKQEKFTEALQRYTEASALQPKDPVYHSNISAVQYEIGKYGDCVRTIDIALPLLSPPNSPNPQLATRLLLRKAKSLFYSNKFREAKEAVEQLTRECESSGIANPDAGGALTKALNQSTPDCIEFSICRSSSDTRTPEYFIVGHDRPVSAFSGPLTLAQHDLLREQGDRDEYNKLYHQLLLEAPLRIHFNTPQQSFAFLFGGIGDARHLFESLFELADLCPSPTPKCFHFTMVDIKVTALARDLVMFYIFKHLSQFSLEQMQHDVAAIEVLALAHYTYLGTAMPGYLHETLMKLMGELASDLEHKSLPPWLSVDEASVPGVLDYLHDWLVFDVTAEFMLARSVGRVSDTIDSMLMDEATKHMPGFEDPAATVKAQMEQMTDDEIMDLPLPGKNPAEKRLALNQFFQSNDAKTLVRDSFSALPGVSEEQDSSKMTRIMYPPAALIDRHPELKEMKQREANLSAFIRQQRGKRLRSGASETSEKKTEEADGTKQKGSEATDVEGSKIEGAEDKDTPKPDAETYANAQRHIIKTFKANPTFWDKWWLYVLDDEDYKFRFSPFEAVNTICDHMQPQPKNPTCLYDYISILYSRIALAIAKFGEKNMMLEWVCGDVYKTCLQISHNVEERQAKQFPVSFDRIYLSNIPDYVGGNLPIAIFCSPLMKPVPHAYIGYNILLNTGVFKNYEECVRTYTLLPDTADHERYLGMKHIHGDLWGEDPNWSVLDCPLPTNQLVSQDELASWLYKIFLYIVLPPARQAMLKFRVDHPLNLLAFVTLMNRLATVGYPHHWLAAVMDNLLSGQIKVSHSVHYFILSLSPTSLMLFVKDKSETSSQFDEYTISLKRGSKREARKERGRNFQIIFDVHIYPVATVSTKPFLMELEYAVAACAKHLPFSLLTSIPALRHVTLNCRPKLDPRDDQRACIIALMFGPQAAFLPGNAPTELQRLRETIINGEPKVVLLSSLRWESQTSKFEFFAAPARLDQMVRDGWYVAAVRLDGYRAVMRPVKVKSAIK